MLVIVCGWAGAGKTTLARLVSRRLAVHYIDMDDLREVATGRPIARPATPAEMEEEAVAMLANYGFMAAIVNWHLENGRSLMLSATFSKAAYWDIFRAVLARHPGASLRVVRCLPDNDHADAVAAVLAEREREGYNSSVNTVARYEEVKSRFREPPVPHLTVRTWGSGASVDDCVNSVLAYVLECRGEDTRPMRVGRSSP